MTVQLLGPRKVTEMTTKLRFGSQLEANLFEKALKDQRVPFERQGPVTIEIPQKLSQQAVDWLEDVSHIHCIGRRD